MMGACLLLSIAGWSVVRPYSVTAAIVMSCVALLIPRWPPQSPMRAIKTVAADVSSTILL